MNKTTADKYAKQIKSIYPSYKTWVEKGWHGWEIHQTTSEGTYHQKITCEESAQDYISIHK